LTSFSACFFGEAIGLIALSPTAILSSDFFEEAAEAPESETQSFKIRKNFRQKILQKKILSAKILRTKNFS